MNKIICVALLWLFATGYVEAQQFYFPKGNEEDSVALASKIKVLASSVFGSYKPNADKRDDLNNLFRLQILAGKYAAAIQTIAPLRELSKADDPKYSGLLYMQYQLFAQAKLKQVATGAAFNSAYADVFDDLFKRLDGKSAMHISFAFITRNGVGELRDNLQQSLQSQKTDSVGMDEAIGICKSYFMFYVYGTTEALAIQLLKQDENRRYDVKDVLIKTKDGATISAIVVRPRNLTGPQPVILQYTIYAEDGPNLRVVEPATYGYTGVIAYTRGKRFSPDKIIPFEYDGADANDVIGWISKQSWCNGKVAMYGGSYNGFTQWAAAKYHHPALKTIVPYVAAIPGFGLPMENNIFLNANYGWSFYTTDNKFLDNKTYNDPKRWNDMPDRWYASGAAYRKIDSIDGTANPFLQKYLKHQAFDKFWQQQVPYQNDFAAINIPVLTFSGYYDDGQISALRFLTEHYKYNPKAEHYLVIGPYDHFGAQRGGEAVLRDYQVDPVALISTRDITFQWFDYILKGAKRPDMVKDKVNYELMGANAWKHAPSIKAIANKTLKLYLTDAKQGDNYSLSSIKPLKPGKLKQEVDFANRKTSNNNNYYPYPIIKKEIDKSNGLFFISQPFDKTVSVNGIFSGVLKATINKRDMDIGVTLFELMPDGRYFQLSYFLGRASYTADMSKRVLLHPGVTETIPFSRARLVSRQLSKGSRLLIEVNINKNSGAQVNYGTGKDVSDEDIRDAKVPLKIQWHTDSYINVPVLE